MCELSVKAFMEKRISITHLSDAASAYNMCVSFRRKVYDEDKTLAASANDLPTFCYVELGQFPAETTDKTEIARGGPAEWKAMLEAMRELCAASPATTAACIVYATRGSGKTRSVKMSRLQYNAQVLQPLCKGLLAMDHEVSFRFAAARLAYDRRAPRTGCLAVHGSAKKERDNIFTYALPDFCMGELDWSFPRPTDADQKRVQSLDKIREEDVLERRNMSARDREELLGRGFYEKLFGKISLAAGKVHEFANQQKLSTARGSHVDEDGMDDDDEDDDMDDDDAVEPNHKRVKTEGAEKHETSTTPKKEPQTSGLVLALLQGSPRPAPPTGSPWIVIAVGAGNGNLPLGFLDSCASTNGRLLILEPGRTHVEFSNRRVTETLCQAWFAGKLPGAEKPKPIPERITVDKLAPFHPSPLCLSSGEGRLLIPENILRKFERNDATAATVEDFKAKHYEKFMDGNLTVARIQACLQGQSASGAGTTTAAVPPAALADGDPATVSALKALQPKVTCPSFESKGQLHVISVEGEDRLYMTIMTTHGVTAGEKIAFCGSGKFWPAEKAQAFEQQGRLAAWPNVKDDDLVIFRDTSQNPPVDRPCTMYALVSELAAKGKIDPENVVLPFHTHRYIPATNADRAHHEFTPTYEQAWTPKRSALNPAEGAQLTPVNILSAMARLPAPNDREKVCGLESYNIHNIHEPGWARARAGARP